MKIYPLYVFLPCLLAACGGGTSPTVTTGSDLAPTSAVTNTTQTVTISQQVLDLEKAGTLPTLDRTTSLKGRDENNNGIRDDIEKWIQLQPFNSDQKTALLQLAQANQSALTVDTTSDVDLRAVVALQHAGIKCVVRRNAGTVAGNSSIKTLRNYTYNTKERIQAYAKYNAALDGSVMKSPEGDGCAQ